jgi:PIN domain nuclease of toxin-antitoxin system
MSGGIVLDAWAALAFLQREEPAALIVRRLLRRAVRGNVRLLINAVNLGEVYYRLLQTAGAERADERGGSSGSG